MESFDDQRPLLDDFIPKKEDRFASTKYKDVWAFLLWLITFFGFIAFQKFTIGHLYDEPTTLQAEFEFPISHVYGLITTGLSIGFLSTTGYFIAMQKYTGKMIRFSLISSIGMQFIIAGLFFFYYLKSGEFELLFGTGAFLFVGLFLVYAYQLWKVRIPFARIMLKTVTSITQMYPATLFTGVIGMVFQTCFVIWWLMSIVGLAVVSKRGLVEETTAKILLIYALFVFYWTTQIIKNAVHLTIAGLFGTFYFLGVSSSTGGEVEVPVRNPTLQSAIRAMTISIGSNCYGSLLIAIVQVIRTLVNIARSQAREDRENIACSVFLCCLECIINMIENILEYFNKYAFTQVAIYGKAGRDTFELAKARGVDAIINDDLIGNVLGIGNFAVGLLGLASGLIYVKYSTLVQDPIYYAIAAVVTFMISVIEFSVLATVIDSGTVSTFVCLADDPEALSRTKPELFEQVQSSYPQVVSIV